MVWYAKVGYTAVAPKPIKHAIWWVSLAEEVVTIMFASDLNPSLTKCWWTAPTANKAFIGKKPSSGKSSIKWIIEDPDLTAFSTSFWSFLIADLRFVLSAKTKLISADLK